MGSVSEEFCVLVTIDETLKFVWRRKVLACNPVWVWGCIDKSSVETEQQGQICDCEAPQRMLPLRQKLSAWLQPFRADQILVSETRITWKWAYPLWFCQEGRADDGTGELGQFVGTPVSASNISWAFRFHFRTLEGLEDTRRREYLAQEG